VCYDRRGKPTPDAGTGPMSLEGTPFTFSKRNRLVNIGCNYNLFGQFHTIIGGSCSGEACCEQDISDLGVGICPRGENQIHDTTVMLW
jgi:hypothetical protein